jgi:hypothetical protein
MKDWQENNESLTRLFRSTAIRLLNPWSPVYRGSQPGEVQRTLILFYHNVRKIVFRTRDVVLISTPKSGRTWLRFMLDEVGIHIQYTHLGGRLERPQDLPSRAIHLHRDPRDTVTSAWFQHSKRSRDYDGHFSDFLRDPVLGLEQRVRFNLFWAMCVSESGGCVTSYERLHADTPNEVRRILQFIKGKTPREEMVRKAVAAGDFQRMRAVEASGKGARLYGFALAPADPADPETYKTREGRVGAWEAHFSEMDKAFANDVLQNHDYFDRMRQIESGHIPMNGIPVGESL